MKYKDLTGKTFGRLTVLELAPERKQNKVTWLCQCSCGKLTSVVGNSLSTGNTTSCGCAKLDRLIKYNKEVHRTHNRYDVFGDYTKVWTNSGVEFVVDTSDLDVILNYGWYTHPDGYIRGFENGAHFLLHRKLMNAKDDEFVDHRNGITLDNRRCNLRICTNEQNAQNAKLQVNNTVGFKGVTIKRRKNGKLVYCASIGFNGKRIYLGEFYNIEEAINARIIAEKKYYGEFSRDFGPQILTVLS